MVITLPSLRFIPIYNSTSQLNQPWYHSGHKSETDRTAAVLSWLDLSQVERYTSRIGASRATILQASSKWLTTIYFSF